MGVSWNESLAIGVEEIDRQHRELVDRFARLLDACEQGKGQEELVYMLDFLDSYVQYHFGDEEALQLRHTYPAYQEHRNEHQAFVKRIASLRQQVEREGVELVPLIKANHLLYAWLVDHISRSDKGLGRFLEQLSA